HAQGDTMLASQDNIANSGAITAYGNTTLDAAGRVDSAAGAVLAAGVNPDNTVRQGGDLSVSAGAGAALHGVAVAGGTASIGAAGLDVSGASVSGAAVKLRASGGDLDASRALISARDGLGLDAAGLLRTDGAQVTGGQITLAAHDVSNAAGQIVQLGSGELGIRLPGQLDNSAGRIATNSGKLTLDAQGISNTDGKIEHAGSGALLIRAATISDQRGQITSNGALALTADTLDHRDAATVAAQVDIASGTLDNRGGAIAQTGAGRSAISATGTLLNSGGKIDTNGGIGLGAGALLNDHGRIAAAHDAGIVVAAGLDNRDGVLVASGNLALAAANLDNSRGYVQAASGDASVRVGDLNNSGGYVFAGASLSTSAGNLNNSGSLYAGADQRLAVGGTLLNSGAIIARGHNAVSAAVIQGSTGSLLGAGIQADGSLGQTGDLSVSATQALTASGQNLAAGYASLRAASLDISGSQTGAANILLSASDGDVLTAKALVSTSGTLTVAAPARSLVNHDGTLSAGQLELHAANLDNRSGSIIQTGSGNTAIDVAALDNSAGRIAVNSASLALGANTLNNSDGKIEHAGSGSLAITAALLNGARGSIVGNGLVDIAAGMFSHDHASTSGQQLRVQAGGLDNRGGHLLQTGTGAATVGVTAQLNNTAGEIASNGSLDLHGGAIDNRQGRITSAASAEVGSAGALLNTDGVLAATGNLHAGAAVIDNTRGLLQTIVGALGLETGSLLNRQGTVSSGSGLSTAIHGDFTNEGLLYAGRDQVLNTAGVLSSTGSIASLGDTIIQANSVASSGLLGAGLKADGSLVRSGNLTLNSVHGLLASGQNLAAGSLSLTGASIDVSGSQTGAANIALTAISGNVITSKAVVSTAGLLAITANAQNGQTLLNTVGQLSAGQLNLDVAKLDNASGDIVQTGAGDTTINTGLLDNTSGRIALNSRDVNLQAANLINVDGKIQHAGSGTLGITAAKLYGQRGQITGNGALNLAADYVDHRNGALLANQVSIHSGTLDNRGASIGQTGAGQMAVAATATLDNSGGKIEGNGDALVKAGILLNQDGRIASAHDAAISASTLDNTGGSLAASNKLLLSGGNVDNTRGQIQALGGNATLAIGDLLNTAGSVFAGANLDATAANINSSGSLYAAGNQTFNVSGAIVNSGVIAARGHTGIAASSVDSGAASLIGAGIKADGSLAGSGDLTITTAQGMKVLGQNLAAGSASLSGATVDLSGSQTSAVNIALTAAGGNVITGKAVVTTPGTLTVNAEALLNHEGALSAGQLALRLANLNNQQGSIVQTGSGDTLIQASAALDNSAGRIAVNSQNLTLGAATLSNTGGKIEHACSGALTIQAATLNGERGTMTGNGLVDIRAGSVNHAGATTSARQLTLRADSLNNAGGHLLQTGAADTTLQVAGQLENAGGEIAGNGSLKLHAGSLDNNKGRIVSSTSADIASDGALLNTDGTIAAATALQVGGAAIDNSRGTLQAGSGGLRLDAASLVNRQGTVNAGADLTLNVSGDLLNDGLLYAGRDQVVNTGGLLNNTGSIAALGNTSIAAGTLAGSGLLGAGLKADGSLGQGGNLSVNTVGALQAGGQTLAAGNLALAGAALDLSGGQASAVNLVLTANSGNIITSKATLSTTGLLAISANARNGQALINQGGSLSAAQLELRAANLDNRQGTIVQTGTGDTTIDSATLDNTGGRIAVNSANLALKAGTLTNLDGKIEHAGSGALDINASNLYGQRGQITGNGALTVAAGYIDHRDGSAIARQVTFNAGTLDNRQGEITQLGTGQTTITTSDRLDNSGGKIASNGDLVLQADALVNDHGRIASGQNLNLSAASRLDNSDGAIAAGRNLVLAGGNIDNSRGQIQAVAGNATLNIANLLNAAGSVFAGARLSTTAASVSNSGSLYAAGEQVLNVSGAVSNSGMIFALGNTSIAAGSLNSSTGGLIGAGIKADGSLNAGGDLTITTAQALAAHGQNLAAGNLALSGGAVDIGASQTGARNIALNASGGDVTTSGAVVTTPGTLSVTAQANQDQGWVNSRGDVSAGQLAVQVANLNNAQGSMVQTGTGDSSIKLSSPGGTLDNSGGRIAVNSANLNIQAGTLNNVDGKIEQVGSGTLAITAAALNGQRGQITSNGGLNISAAAIDHRNASTIAQQVTVSAATLDNRQGNFTQLGNGQTSIQASASLDNRGGVIASNGATRIVSQLLNNQGGKLQAAGASSLDLAVGGTLDNSNGGAIASGANAAVNVGTLNNAGGSLSAGGALTLAAAQAVSNAGGLLAATGNLGLTAATLDNSGGKLASVQGNVSAVSSGATINDGGAIQAGGDILLNNGGLSNALATIAGRNIGINTNGQALANGQGTIAASQALNLQTGALNNDGGLIQSGAALLIDTHGQALTNTNAGAYAVRHAGSSGGISSGASASLNLGAWNNSGGYLGAAGDITGNAGLVTNTSGQIVGKSALNMGLAGLNNQGGQIQVLGNIDLLASGTIDNQSGLIRSGASATLSAAAIENSNTLGASQGIEAINLALTSAYVGNAGGALRADNNLAISSAGSANNTLGMISAGKALSLRDEGAARGLAIANSGGTLIGGQLTDIRAASLSGDGRILSQNDMKLDLSGNFVLGAGGELTANRNLGIAIDGSLSNAGKIQAGSTLTLGAVNLDNSASGDINAGTTRLNIGNTLTNRGVIDGLHTELNAGTLNNLGSGRIYGDALSIAAATVNNDIEGGVAATIAARERLDIGAQIINNREHALIFSGGDMAIGGYLDANRVAAGWASNVTNASATIEALGNLNLGASQVNLLNNHFSMEVIATGTPEHIVEYRAGLEDKVYREGDPGVFMDPVGSRNIIRLHVPGRTFDEYQKYDVTRSTSETRIVTSDPGKIISGKDLTVNSGRIYNENSRLIAGAALNIDKAVLVLNETKGQKIISEKGSVTTVSSQPDFKGNLYSQFDTETYAPPDRVVEQSQNGSSQYEPGKAPAGSTRSGVSGATSNAGAVGGSLHAATVARDPGGVGGVNAASGRGAGMATGAGGPGSAAGTGNAAQAGPVGAVSGAAVAAAAGIAGNQAPASMAAQIGRIDAGANGDSAGQAVAAGGPGGTSRAGNAGQGGAVGAVSGAQLALASGAAGISQGAIAAAHGAGISTASGGAARANGVAGGTQARVNGIAQVALSNPSGRAQVVRTTTPATQIPDASLFKVAPSPSSRYLVETDPRFTNYRDWTSSDYLLSMVKQDPDVTQKRLGDAFYEQRLVREQIAELTGQRFVGDYTSDEQQYRALMEAGAAYANTWNLRPGVALTPAQMAALTSDIVWLVEQDITLADGSTQKALVPQVYVRVREGDLDGSGALLAGKDVNINLSGDLSNSGSIAGRDVVRLTADNVDNLGGRIHGDAVAVSARNDLNNIGGAISANSELIATAGRDLKVETTVRHAEGGDYPQSRNSIDRVAGLYVTGDGGSGTLVAAAGRDVSILGGVIGNAGKDGVTSIVAGRDLTVGSVRSDSNDGIGWHALGGVADTGSQVRGAGGVSLKAGGDIDIVASKVKAGDALAVLAGGDIHILAGTNTVREDGAVRQSGSDFLDTRTVATRDTLDRTLDSGLSGKSVAVIAGNDIKVVGSSVAAGQALLVNAGRDLSVATTTHSSSGFTRDSIVGSTVVDQVAGLYVSGAGAGGNLSVGAGRDITLTAAQVGNAGKDGATVIAAGRDLTLNTVATASHSSLQYTTATQFRNENHSGEVGSQIQAGGDVVLKAGQDLSLRAAEVQAAGALGLGAGRNIAIGSGVETSLLDIGHQETSSGMLSSTTTTTRDTVATSTALGSELGGKTVSVASGNDIKVSGSNILSDTGTSLVARNDISIEAATDTTKELHHSEVKKSGLMSGCSFGFSYGTQTTTIDQERDATIQSGQSRSAVGAIGGDVAIAAGGALNISGSDIAAGGDLDLLGKSVAITPGQDNEKGKFEVKTRQDGL
ncbi:beta strand repeat-containing protein, partial [Janthinobacterium agaricidamnosum]|uniref:beta strand repeat-containing protein n=1 Tax=Janthinobacterium agaricidamnosum TaxID=55508 RepID=UPI00077441E1